MLTPYVDVNFTRLTNLSITCDTERIEMKSGDERCRIVLFLTEDRKEAIRHIVRQWNLDDEAEARGENAVCADCGKPTDYDDPQVIPTLGDRYTVSGPTRDGGFIVRDNETGRNAAFDRRDVHLTFGEYSQALAEAQRLDAEALAR